LPNKVHFPARESLAGIVVAGPYDSGPVVLEKKRRLDVLLKKHSRNAHPGCISREVVWLHGPAFSALPRTPNLGFARNLAPCKQSAHIGSSSQAEGPMNEAEWLACNDPNADAGVPARQGERAESGGSSLALAYAASGAFCLMNRAGTRFKLSSVLRMDWLPKKSLPKAKKAADDAEDSAMDSLANSVAHSLSFFVDSIESEQYQEDALVRLPGQPRLLLMLLLLRRQWLLNGRLPQNSDFQEHKRPVEFCPRNRKSCTG